MIINTHKYVNIDTIVNIWNVKFMIKYWSEHEYYECSMIHVGFLCSIHVRQTDSDQWIIILFRVLIINIYKCVNINTIVNFQYLKYSFNFMIKTWNLTRVIWWSGGGEIVTAKKSINPRRWTPYTPGLNKRNHNK